MYHKQIYGSLSPLAPTLGKENPAFFASIFLRTTVMHPRDLDFLRSCCEKVWSYLPKKFDEIAKSHTARNLKSWKHLTATIRGTAIEGEEIVRPQIFVIRLRFLLVFDLVSHVHLCGHNPTKYVSRKKRSFNFFLLVSRSLNLALEWQLLQCTLCFANRRVPCQALEKAARSLIILQRYPRPVSSAYIWAFQFITPAPVFNMWAIVEAGKGCLLALTVRRIPKVGRRKNCGERRREKSG